MAKLKSSCLKKIKVYTKQINNYLKAVNLIDLWLVNQALTIEKTFTRFLIYIFILTAKLNNRRNTGFNIM